MKTGDKITLVHRKCTTSTQIRKPLSAEDPSDELRVDVATGGSAVLDPGDEGIRWLRGHYLPDAPEVDACRVALALGKQEPAKLTAQNPHIPLLTRAIVDITARVLTNLILEKKP